MTQHAYDLVILGGGLAGLTLARQMVREFGHMRILVLERGKRPAPEAGFKVGESSVEMGAWYLAKVLGLEQHIQESHLPKLGLRFFFNSPQHKRLEQGLEMGLFETFPTGSYQLDRGRLENFLAEELKRDGVQVLSEAKVRRVDLGEDGHLVSWVQEGAELETSARWVVDASGRAALLKKQLKLALPVDHHINAAWFRLDAQIKVDDWEPVPPENLGQPNKGNRWLSTNHLMGEGYWVWLIPLADGKTSVGIVADPELHPLSRFNQFERALDWLHEHQPICGAAIEKERDSLMDFIAIKDFNRDCERVFSSERWAITGEAGVFADPFYSPGSDFIAVSNTFICAMIKRDLCGRPIAGQTEIYNRLYLEFFRRTMAVYQDQYPLFGNPAVMSCKIAWDYCVYWSFLAFLFIQGQLTNVGLLSQLEAFTQEIGRLNQDMQDYFRSWHQQSSAEIRRGFINQGAIAIMARLNAGLTEAIEVAEIPQRCEAYLQDLQALRDEIKAQGTASDQLLQLEAIWEQIRAPLTKSETA